MSHSKTVIIVAGPTAVGKTAIAIHLATAYSTAVISADSRQCYKELNIGVARPSPEELATVPHYFIASHSIKQEVSAASFEQYALEKVKEVFVDRDIAIVCGGTGLYIRAFSEGMDIIPAIDPEIRNTIVTNYKEKGLEWLQEELQKEDPLFCEQGEIRNPQRCMRALEVIRGTGQSITSFQKGNRTARPFTIIKIGLELPRDLLYERINQRVDKMMVQGLLEEVKQLQLYKDLNALQTVGYTELFDYLGGNNTLDKAVEKIKQHTRHYAKRQMTWFKRDKEMTWFHPGDSDEILTWLNKQVK